MSLLVRCEFGTATHCVWGVLICRNQLVCICCNAHASDDKQESRSNEEVLQKGSFLAICTQINELSDGIGEYHDCKVICDLRMVGLYLETQSKSEEGRSKNRFWQPLLPALTEGPQSHPVCEDDSCKNPREIGDSLHLGVMSHLDDLHVVRAESDGDGACNSNQFACAERQHQEETSDERDEQVTCRAASCQKEIINRICPVPFKRVNRSGGRHASEHGVGPCGRVFRVSRIVGHSLVRHTFPRCDIALVDDLSIQHLRSETVCRNDEQQEDPRIYSDILQYCLIHCSFLSVCP